MSIISAILFTLLLALSVKQLSYALTDGSLFSPLRQLLQRLADERVVGFKMLHALFTCKLCMTMQVSIWIIMLPLILAEIRFGLWHEFFSVSDVDTLSWTVFLFMTFVYQTAVSALALALWIHLEYPAKRYEDTWQELLEARRTIADLSAALKAKGLSVPETLSTEGISYDDFRVLMRSMNNQCGKYGCGYTRRHCRSETVAEWLEGWAASDPLRREILPQLRKEMRRLLPDYFRRYSKNDWIIENEEAFTRLHQDLTSKISI